MIRCDVRPLHHTQLGKRKSDLFSFLWLIPINTFQSLCYNSEYCNVIHSKFISYLENPKIICCEGVLYNGIFIHTHSTRWAGSLGSFSSPTGIIDVAAQLIVTWKGLRGISGRVTPTTKNPDTPHPSSTPKSLTCSRSHKRHSRSCTQLLLHKQKS